MTASTLPILDPRVATDRCLDARAALQDVRDSCLDGDDLNLPIVKAIEYVDVGMKILEELRARRVEQRRVDVEQLGETS